MPLHIFLLKTFSLYLSLYIMDKIDFDYSCYPHLIEQESRGFAARKKIVEDSDSSDLSVYSDMDGEHFLLTFYAWTTKSLLWFLLIYFFLNKQSQ